MTAVPPRPAAPDATAGDDLRSAIAEAVADSFHADTGPLDLRAADAVLALPALRDVLAERDLLQRQLVHMTAERDGLTRKLRDVLAAARDDAQRVATLEAQCAALQRLAEECEAAAARDAEKVRRVEALLAGMDPIEVALGGLMYVHGEVRRALDAP